MKRFIARPTTACPAFGKSDSGNSTKKALLTPAEIDLVARLLRGEL